jgi:Protein of unknown function (DUF3168)
MSPSLELQELLVTGLKANVGVASVLGTRIYDNVPENPIFPYLSWGPESSINADATGLRASEMAVQLDVWSRKPGSAECRKACDVVKRYIEATDFYLSANALCPEATVEAVRIFRDADGRTWHGVISVILHLEQL